MSWVKVIRILDRDKAIVGLAHLKPEWQEAANGKILVEMQASVGLLLADVVDAFGLMPEEAAQVLSGSMYIEPAKMSVPELVRR